MNVLIVIPTQFEAERILPRYKSILVQGELIDLKSGSDNIFALITGPGPFLTTYHLGRLLLQKKFDLVVQLGIAGSHDHNIQIPQLVNITSDQFIDFGSEDGKNRIDAQELGFYQHDELLNESTLSPEIKPTSNMFIKDIYPMKGVTVYTATGSVATGERIVSKYGMVSESMEGAAFFYCCLKENTPCLQIRAISNVAGPRNKDEWKTLEALDLLKSYMELNFKTHL